MRLWGRRSSSDTLKAYVSAINAADLAKVGELMADDMLLVDSSADEVSGRDNCLALVERMLALAPDYHLRIDSCIARGQDVLLTGVVTGTSGLLGKATHFRARADHEKVFEWHNYSAVPFRTLAHLKAAKAPAKSPSNGSGCA